MPTDSEYLAKAGIDAETGGASAPDTASNVSTTETAPAATAEATKPTEYFEINGQQFPTSTEFKLAHDGKIVKVPYGTMANVYRQATHFEDKNKKFNEERQKWEAQKTSVDQALAFKEKYGPIQEWSEKNPTEWEKLWNVYQNKDKHLLESQLAPHGAGAAKVGAQAELNQLKPLLDEISKMKAELGGLNEVKSQWEKTQEAQREAKDVEFVKNEMSTFQKDYPEINLEERDPDGVTLWAKVMKFGIDSRLPDFESAALKFLKPRLQDTWASRARNEVVKGFKTDRQQGIVQRSATPILGQGQSKTIDPSKMSYAEITEAAKNGSFAASS